MGTLRKKDGGDYDSSDLINIFKFKLMYLMSLIVEYLWIKGKAVDHIEMISKIY